MTAIFRMDFWGQSTVFLNMHLPLNTGQNSIIVGVLIWWIYFANKSKALSQLSIRIHTPMPQNAVRYKWCELPASMCHKLPLPRATQMSQQPSEATAGHCAEWFHHFGTDPFPREQNPSLKKSTVVIITGWTCACPCQRLLCGSIWGGLNMKSKQLTACVISNESCL